MSYAHKIVNVIEAIESFELDDLDDALDSLNDYANEYGLELHEKKLLADLKARCNEDIEEQETADA